MNQKLICDEFIIFNLDANSKEDVIKIMAEKMKNRFNDKDGYIADVLAREKSSSTAVGMGVATPHAKSGHVITPSLGFASMKNSFSWDGNENVSMVFLIAVPNYAGERHLEILSKLCRKIIHDDFRNDLLKMNDTKEVVKLFESL